MFSDSSLVFVPDALAKYVPARVIGAIQPGKPGMVALLDDTGRPKVQLELPGNVTAGLIRMDEESLRSVPDMVEFKLLSEASVLHNLRLRFRTDDIYTAIGDVLIAVNPYKMLPLYTPIMIDSFISSNSPSASPPHPYKVADNSFRRLVELKKNQACMVTGESGSGKTELCKIFLQYIAEVSSAWSDSRKAGLNTPHSPTANISNAALSDKILKSNPLLESFGNASTRRNNNSSRFGKLIEVFIDSNSAEISSARTTIFLLEKSRLPSPTEGERNFHVFYQLCAGARVHPEIKEQYEVLDQEDYRYLTFPEQGVSQTTRVSDIMGWEDMMKAMKVLRISLEMRDETLRIVSGILHLGNIDFEVDGTIHHSQASKIANPATLATAERLLGLKDLAKALTLKSVSAGSEIVLQHQPVDKAKKGRDALAISIYSTLFSFLAGRINDTMSEHGEDAKSKANKRTMGILDIFGFESFPGASNSFEQLCINYCNEKLQHQFNEFVFFRERAEYEREGVSLSTNPSALLEKSQRGTQFVLDVFERPRVGLFHLMDEESAVPGGSDHGLLKKMLHEYSANPGFEACKKDLADIAFVIRHYVGPVIYKVAGMLEKNDEGTLSKDIQVVCAHSTLDIIKSSPTMTKSHLGTQFATQLDRLVSSLSEMEPHFVRCIKPNTLKKGGVFNPAIVLEQLRYAGILEVCKIRQLGFPIRRDFSEFRNRYSALAKLTSTKTLAGLAPKRNGQQAIAVNMKEAVEALCREFTDSNVIGADQFACGKSKVFLKSSGLVALEERLDRLKVTSTITIQRRVRGFLTRRRMKNTVLVLQRVKVSTEIGSSLAELREALMDESLRRLLGGGKHLPVIRKGWKRAAQLQETVFGRNILTRAVAARDAHAIQSALACTSTIVSRDDPLITQATQLLSSLQGDESQIQALEAQLGTGGATEMAAVAEKAASLLNEQKSDSLRKRLQIIVEKARARLARGRIELEARKQLEGGLDSKTQDVVVQATSKLKAMGVTAGDTLLRRASMFLKMDLTPLKDVQQVEPVPEAIEMLQAAMATRNADQIAMAMVRVISEGLEGHPVVLEAAKVEASLRKSAKDEKSLSDASSVIEMKSQNKEGGGLEPEDLVMVESVREQVEDFDLKVKAEVILASAQEIIEAQNGLRAALAIGPSIEFDKLRQTLERAYAVGLTGGELVYRVQKMMRAKNRERRMAKKKKVAFDLEANAPEKRKKKPVIDLHALQVEKQTFGLINMAKAEGDRFLMSHYYLIRNRMDGDEPQIKHKRGRVLETSILETTTNAQAETISKLILGYTGERSASFPPTCAKTLLEMGLEASEIADEIYIQLCAHLTENSSAESATRTWQLLCLVIATFFPTQDLLLFIVRFLSDRAEGRTDAALGAEKVPGGPLPNNQDNYTLEQRYAWYCLKRLLKDLANMDSAQPPVPSIEEIQAYGERVPVVTNVSLPDGSILVEDALIGPLMTVQDVTALCMDSLGITQKELLSTFGLFVRPVDKDALTAVGSALETIQREASSTAVVPTPQDREDSKESEFDEAKKNALRSSLRLQKASSRTRFRLSITAVFGFGRGTKTESGDETATVEADNQKEEEDIDKLDKDALFAPVPRMKSSTGTILKPRAKKTTNIVSARRTEDDVDWDVPLSPSEHVGDVLLRFLRAGRGAPRLVFKKRIFIISLEAKARATRTPQCQVVVSRVEALQAIDDFSTGALPFDKEDDVAEVVAARVALKFDNKLPAIDPERLMAIGQVDLFVPSPWRSKKSELNWARAVLEKKGKILGKDVTGLRMKILEKCRTRPMYGCQVFRVTKRGDIVESLLTVSEKGFASYQIKELKPTGEYDFEALDDFRTGRGNTVVLKLKGKPEVGGESPKSVTFASVNAKEIVELAREYQRVKSGWDVTSDSLASATNLIANSSHVPSAGSVINIGQPVTGNGESLGGGRTFAQRASSAVEEPEEIIESLRERMERMGANAVDIADVLRT